MTNRESDMVLARYTTTYHESMLYYMWVAPPVSPNCWIKEHMDQRLKALLVVAFNQCEPTVHPLHNDMFLKVHHLLKVEFTGQFHVHTCTKIGAYCKPFQSRR